MRKVKIGIVGCGAMGSKIAASIINDFAQMAVLSALYDVDTVKAKALAAVSKQKNIVVSSIENLIKKSSLVIEAAHPKYSGIIARKAIQANRDCMIMSVGGLLDAADIFSLANRKKRAIYIPSGAICGIDGLKAHALANLKRITLTTRKPPEALKGAPYIRHNNINLDVIKSETTIFEGNVAQAILDFPQNINVAATLALAAKNKDKVKVRIVCSPFYKGNTHEIEIESDAGKTFIRCENEPSLDNPKTSYLAVLAAIAALRQIFDAVKIGT